MPRRIAFRPPVLRFMQEAGLNQKQLATEAGVPEPTLSRFINGHNVPSAANVLRLAKTLGCEPWELLDDPTLAPEVSA